MSKTKETQYISKVLRLRLVNKSSYSKEVAGRVIVVQGSSIQFEDGVYATDNPAEVEFLEGHPNFGSVFIKVKKNAEEEKVEIGKTLSDKRQEAEAQKDAEERKGKKLEEGSGLPKKRGKKSKSKSTKKEKPAF